MDAPLIAAAQAVVPPTIATHLTEIGVAVILAINVWQVRATLAFRDDARKLSQWAFGPEGANGADGDIKALRAKAHHHGDEIHSIRGLQQLHELRLDSVERRHGPDDRREAHL